MNPANLFKSQGNNLNERVAKINTTNSYTQQQVINELQEETNKLMHQQIANKQPTKTRTAHQTAKLSQALKKRKHSFYEKQRPVRRHQLNYSNPLHQTNYDNIIKI